MLAKFEVVSVAIAGVVVVLGVVGHVIHISVVVFA